MRKIIIATLLLFASIWAAEDGTRENPLTIGSIQDLVDFRSAISDSGEYKGVTLKEGGKGLFFKQTADLDLSTLCGREVGNWAPITPFMGSYDGGNHSISNLYIDDSLGKVGTPGFFGTVFNQTSDTTFFVNMNFTKAYIRTSGIAGTIMTQIVTGKVIVQHNNVEITYVGPFEDMAQHNVTDIQVGGLMGNTVAEWVGIYDNTVKGSFTITGKHGINLGGLVGVLVDPTTIEGNQNEANINISGDSYMNIGGIAGEQISACTMKNNVNTGNITIEAENDFVMVGGLVGVEPTMSQKRYTYGNSNYGKISVTGGQAVEGGLYGLIIGDAELELDSNINYGEVIYNGTGYRETLQIGGIAGAFEIKKANRFINNGDITVVNAVSPNVGGITGFVRPAAKSLDLSNSVNSGNIVIKNDSTIGGWISGIVGYSAELEYIKIDSCVNKGDITFEGEKDSSLFVAAIASVPPQTVLSINTSTNEGAVTEQEGVITALAANIPGLKMNIARLGDGRISVEIPGIRDYSRVRIGIYSYDGKQIPVQLTRSGNMFYLEGIPTLGRYVIRVKTPLGFTSKAL